MSWDRRCFCNIWTAFVASNMPYRYLVHALSIDRLNFVSKHYYISLIVTCLASFAMTCPPFWSLRAQTSIFQKQDGQLSPLTVLFQRSTYSKVNTDDRSLHCSCIFSFFYFSWRGRGTQAKALSLIHIIIKKGCPERFTVENFLWWQIFAFK